MVIDYTTKGKVVFTIFDYIENVLNEIPEVFAGNALNPSCNHLFDTNENQTKVRPPEQEMFHNNVVTLL